MTEKLQTIVFLVRHGETDRYYSTQRSIDELRHLTPNGHRQAEAVGQYLADFAPTAIYSSPLGRCEETAKIIAEKGANEVKVQLTDQLLEIYSAEPRNEAGERGVSIFATILENYPGEQVVAVTHQYIIGYIVAGFLKVGYHDVPCDFADVYRLVFAGKTLVEATHLQPAKVSHG